MEPTTAPGVSGSSLLSLTELERAVRVVEPRVVGRRIQEIAQPDGQRVVLTAYGSDAEGAGRVHLLLSSNPDAGRLSLLSRPPRRPPSPPRFAQWLKVHVSGARIEGLRLPGEDRVVALDLTAPTGDVRLVLQLLARRSNLYAFDAQGCLVAALRPLAGTRPELALGAPWKAPETGPPRRGADRFEAVGDAELLAAIEEHYGAQEVADSQAELRRRIDRSLSRERRRVARKLDKLAAELAKSRQAEELARHGELLKGALSRVRRGTTAVTVRDDVSGEDVTIALDPALSPSENLDGLFRRYKKALRRLAKGGAQHDSVSKAQRELEALSARFAAAADDEALRVFAGTEEVRSLLARHTPVVPGPRGARAGPPAEVQLGKHRVPRRLVPRRYVTAGGLEVWVGRSDAANDFLTTRLARGKDLFFHLDGAPGSHVVLRTEGRDDPPSDAVLDACELAVHYSKAKNASRADVHVVPIRNVRKPKGAKPGLVTVHGGRTVHLRRAEARLERVLGARIED